jgi:hypothetical protein
MRKAVILSRYTILGIVLSMCWLPPSAYAAKVQTWVEKGIDFSQYKTYQWLPPKLLTKTGVVEDDPVLTPLIKDALNGELSRKGLKEVPEGADLQVSTLALAESIPQLEAMIFTGAPTDFTSPIGTVGRYNRAGTLVVNLIDRRTKKSAWCGMVKESLDNKPGAGRKKIGPAVSKLFKKFPNTSAGKRL